MVERAWNFAFSGREGQSIPLANGDLLLHISRHIEDPDWDSFVARNPGGNILQTSLWSRLKAESGWSPVRLIVRQRDQIVGGVQMLTKRVLPFVKIGVVLQGPLNATSDSAVTESLLLQLRKLCKRRSIQFFMMQFPNVDSAELRSIELPTVFQHSIFDHWVPQATILVDLQPDSDDLLQNMHSKTRYNIRLGIRKGINIREGLRSELDIFHRLLLHTGERQSFSPQPIHYFESMWDILAEKGHMKIFFAEFEGKILSAILVTMFGDRVVYKRGGWSGEHGNYHPNEVLHWEVMKWAKSAGYRYYDFDGIDLDVAVAVTNGEQLPPERLSSVARFKQGFGGYIMILPPLYQYVSNPILRWGSAEMLPRMKRVPYIENLLLGINRM